MSLDLTTDMTGDLGPRSAEVREKIIEEAKKIDEGYQKLAQLLYECYDNNYYIRWGFSNFREYCESEGLHYRRSKYLVSIAQVVKELDIAWEDIEGIGWTKMRALIPILEEQRDKGDWLDLAKIHSVKELEALVRDSKIGGISSSGGGGKIISVNLRLTPSQAEIILQALDHAKRVVETDNPEMGFEEMAYRYYMDNEGEPDRLSLETIIAYAERNYGVELVVSGREDITEMLEEHQEVQA